MFQISRFLKKGNLTFGGSIGKVSLFAKSFSAKTLVLGEHL